MMVMYSLFRNFWTRKIFKIARLKHLYSILDRDLERKLVTGLTVAFWSRWLKMMKAKNKSRESDCPLRYIAPKFGHSRPNLNCCRFLTGISHVYYQDKEKMSDFRNIFCKNIFSFTYIYIETYMPLVCFILQVLLVSEWEKCKSKLFLAQPTP